MTAAWSAGASSRSRSIKENPSTVGSDRSVKTSTGAPCLSRISTASCPSRVSTALKPFSAISCRYENARCKSQSATSTYRRISARTVGNIVRAGSENSISAFDFRAVEQHVGPRESQGKIICGLDFTRARRNRHACGLLGPFLDARADSLGNLAGAVDGDAWQDNEKFFAPPPRHEIGCSNAVRRNSRDAAQNAIADCVTSSVVHLLEMIDVNQHQAERALFALG